MRLLGEKKRWTSGRRCSHGRRAIPAISACLLASLCVVQLHLLTSLVNAWVVPLLYCPRTITTIATTTRDHPRIALSAKRNKKGQQSKTDDDDLNRWYESVDASASPDDVFWEEMERQRLLSQVGDSLATTTDTASGAGSSSASSNSLGGSVGAMNGGSPVGSSSSSAATAYAVSATTSRPISATSAATSGGSSSSLSRANNAMGMAASMTQKSVEATLSEYEAFAVSDNWLDEELSWMMAEDEQFNAHSERPLDEQLEEWENEDTDNDDDKDIAWMSSDEPWDHWGETVEEMENRQANQMKFSKASDFLLKDEDDEQDRAELEREKAEFEERLSKFKISSRRLESARSSPKAAAYFGREPDAIEGFDRLWVAAIDNVCFKNLVGTFCNYGVQFADNFGDFQDGCIEDGLGTIEDIASFKARKVFEVTGLPCIAVRTSFEIEPVPNLNTGVAPAGRSAVINANPRVASGYRFNDIGMHVDYMCEALQPLSEPSRVTRFKTCLCYYDGEIEIYDYGVCDCDLLFANSMKTFIPVSAAINEMIKTLELTLGLQYQQWLTKRMEEAASGYSGASMKLRDRVLKEGRVLPNDIIDVSAFMDSLIDVNLMDECARDLSSRFMSEKPNKILTVATTGLVIALPMAKYLQVPVVYARKERTVVMADTYQAAFASKTVGKNRELLVSKQHLHKDDRVLIIDDFLSSGASQEALLRIVSDAGATAVGVGVLLEKVFDAGRQSLSGFDVPIHSLCRVASVKSGVIQLVEEEGFDRMQKSKGT